MNLEEKKQYRAYYYSFESTGDLGADKILELIAAAGKSYHSTQDWNEPLEWLGGKSYVELIQQAAIEAAERSLELETKLNTMLKIIAQNDKDHDELGDRIEKLETENKILKSELTDLAFNYEPCLSCNRMAHAQDVLEKVGK